MNDKKISYRAGGAKKKPVMGRRKVILPQVLGVAMKKLLGVSCQRAARER